MTLDAGTLAAYRATLRKREAAEAATRAARRERAWAAAQRAAALLREDFGADRVVVFGSLIEADGAFFDARSDIDLAAWGIPGSDFFLVVARLQGVSNEFSVDLVAMERCPEHLKAAIDLHGVEL
jgi:uncharacterized protein